MQYRWQRPSLRFLVVLTVPLMVARLARELGYLRSLGFVTNLLPVLRRSPLGPEETAVAGAVALLALIAVLARNRGPQHAIGLGVTALLWLGFVYSTLRWFRLFPGSEYLVTYDAPTNLTLLLAFGILFVPVLYLTLDGFFAARESYQDRDLPGEEVRDASRALARGVTLSLVGGTLLALVLAVAFWRVRDVVESNAGVLPLNPVAGLLVLGLGFALLIASLTRPRDITGRPVPVFAAAPDNAPDAPEGADAWATREMQGEKERKP